MTEAPDELAEFARRLLLREAGERRSADDLIAAMERGSVSLHAQLSPLVSSAGFDALLGRAVRLASRDFPFLAAVTTTTPRSRSLDGLGQGADLRQPEDVERALVAILANFIW